ncbi:hypothetical protein DFH29DRAFT_1072095 [Suillus ampliporus]|nr:hypothetical protein DFH29DRAFT_1072095 [Suillus ampliporus]
MSTARKASSPINAPSTRGSNKPATQAEIEALPITVTDRKTAEQYLTQILICQMSGKTPLPVITAIRAAAFILKKHIACEIAEAAAKQLSDNLTPHIVQHVIAAIAPQNTKRERRTSLSRQQE